MSGARAEHVTRVTDVTRNRPPDVVTDQARPLTSKRKIVRKVFARAKVSPMSEVGLRVTSVTSVAVGAKTSRPKTLPRQDRTPVPGGAVKSHVYATTQEPVTRVGAEGRSILQLGPAPLRQGGGLSPFHPYAPVCHQIIPRKDPAADPANSIVRGFRQLSESATIKEAEMPAVKEYKVTPLAFDAKLVTEVTRRRTDGESLGAIAKALKVSTGKAAMAELVGTTERVAVDDPAKLARQVAKDRKAGASWGLLAARYGITEGTARAAFTAATGQPCASLDYRKKAEVA